MQLPVRRAIHSLTKVKANDKKADFFLKTVTILNLAKKICSDKYTLSIWNHKDCIVKAEFKKIRFAYHLPKGYDFNIYMNPYFHEFEITNFIADNLKENDVFLDVGAHSGLYTIIAGLKTAPDGNVISFEPNPQNLKYLEQNIQLNNLTNILVIPKVVSDENGKASIFFSRDNTAYTSVLGHEKESANVESTTIDSILEKHAIKSVKILKIDTEGYDLKVLKGAQNTLTKTQYVIVEQNIGEIRELLQEKGFNLSTLQPSGYLFASKA